MVSNFTSHGFISSSFRITSSARELSVALYTAAGPHTPGEIVVVPQSSPRVVTVSLDVHVDVDEVAEVISDHLEPGHAAILFGTGTINTTTPVLPDAEAIIITPDQPWQSLDLWRLAETAAKEAGYAVTPVSLDRDVELAPSSTNGDLR